MKNVYDYAKYFIKNGLDTNPNTYDGNMKLQKLLMFANLINLATVDSPLFSDQILAYQHGCVVEKVRQRYKNDYESFLKDSKDFEPDFSEQEYRTLKCTVGIFGNLSASELSDLNHSFEFWKKSYQNSICFNGYKDKDLAIVDIDDMKKETDKIKTVLDAYYESQKSCNKCELINGISFYYDPSEIEIDDETLNKLEDYSRTAEDTSYSLYEDNGSLVIF